MSRRMMAALALASVCADAGVFAQSGTIRGMATVPGPGVTAVAIYLVPTAEAAHAAPTAAVVDQRDLRFVPRVVVVSPGSRVSFPNSDPVLHNVFHPAQRSEAFDLGTYPEGEQRSFTFAKEGAYVIFCHVHPEMVAYVVVVDSPYHTVSGEDGRFRIEGVAPGTYHLLTWHRRLRTRDQLVTVPANGSVDVTLSLQYGFPVEPRAAR